MNFAHSLANRLAGKIGLQKRAYNRWIACRLRSHVERKIAQKHLNGQWSLRSSIRGDLNFCDLHFSERGEDVFLAGKVIEESALAHVRRIGDVLNSRLRIALASEELNGSAKKAFAEFVAAAFAARGCRVKLEWAY